MMGRGRPAAGAKRESPIKKISSQDRKDLQVLADDFGLLGRQDVREKQKRNSTYRYAI